jgi:tRNA dimethylallyltransferase
MPAAAGPRPVALVGPTATGKSELALKLAGALGGEVVNADAMQLYRGMDIGTAKLAPAQRRGVAHHMIDVLAVTEPASVAAYQAQARAALARIQQRGRVPVLTGGSGLYVSSVLDELEFPGTDPAIRARLAGELADHGPGALHERLARSDPAAAEAILPSNGRRIVRALEVGELTGRPFAPAMPRTGPGRYDATVLGLDLPAGELAERVEARAEEMFAGGLLAEVEALCAAGLRGSPTASRAIGYRQAIAVLDGALDRAAAIRATASATRKLVRRQRSWFRRDPRTRWLDAADPELAAHALQRCPRP